MIRRLALLAAAAVLFGAPDAVAAPSLRPSVVVSAPLVRLGDIFADAGAEAPAEVAPAPAAGQRTIFDAKWLAAIAHEHHLDWTPGSDYDQVVVERASRAIGGDAIAARLLAEIGATQPIDNAVVLLDNGGVRLVVPADAGDSLTVDGLTFDPRTGRLSAFVSATAGNANAERQRITGRLVFQTDLPVLTRAMSPGEKITAADIGHVIMRRDQVGPDVITDAAALIGKTPRRLLRAEQTVHTGDVQVPIIIHKDELVTIVLDTPTLHLTAQAKALDDGTMGAAIRVANTSSNRIVDATVRGPNTVSITPTTIIADSAQTPAE